MSQQTPPTTEDPREVFSLFAEPVYAPFDDLTRARLNTALDASLAAARAQAFRDAAQMIENSKPESTNPNLLRALEAYRTALAAGLRISAKLTESAAEVKP